MMEASQAMKLMKYHGYKLTGKRRYLFNILHTNQRFMSVKDIYQQLIKKYPSISFDTIYRNLAMFVEVGVVEQTELNGERKFRLVCEHHTQHVHHHHHFICTSCGKTTIIQGDCPIEQIEKPSDFTITGHRFEIYGNCKECLDNS